MTIEQYHNSLLNVAKLSTQQAVEGIVVPAGLALLGAIKNRIIRRGKNTANSNIGTYSNKAAYYPESAFVKKSAFKPITKKYISTDAKSPKKVKGRKVLGTIYTEKGKTMYLREGYKELREIQGRESSFVNLEYSGDLMLSYQGVPTTNSMQLGFTKESQVKKKEGLETKYGDVFHATKSEIAEYNQEVSEESKKLTLKLLQNV